MASSTVNLSDQFDLPQQVNLASEFDLPDPDKKKKDRELVGEGLSDFLGKTFPEVPSALWKVLLTKGGTAGDVAANVLPPIAGSIAGAPGGPVGVAAGGAAGGAAGATLAEVRQYLRGERDEITAGPIVTNTILGAIPLPGKVSPTQLFAGGKLVAAIPQAIGVRAAQGAVLGAGAEGAGELIDTGTVDLKTLAQSAAWGALFGAGAGALESGALTMAQRKMINQVREKTGVPKSVMTDEQLIQKMRDVRAGKTDDFGTMRKAEAVTEVVQPEVPKLADEFDLPATAPKPGTNQIELPAAPVELVPTTQVEAPTVSPATSPDNTATPTIPSATRIPMTEWGATPAPEVKVAATDLIKAVTEMDPKQLMDWANNQGESGGITTRAREVGRAVQDSPDIIAQLKDLYEATKVEVPKVKASNDGEALNSLAHKSQFYSEAYQAATNTGVELTPSNPSAVIEPKPAMDEVPTPPVKAPETTVPESDPVSPETTALNKAEIANIRKTFDLEKLPAPERQTFESQMQEAKKQGMPENAEFLAESLLQHPRAVTTIEHAGMVIRAAQLQDQYEKLVANASLQMDVGNIDRGEQLRTASEAILDQLEKITQASDLAGPEVARMLNIRKMRINRNTYDLASIVQRARLSKKGRLNTSELEGFRKLSEQLKEKQGKIDTLEKKLAESLDKAKRSEADTFVHEGRALRSRAGKQQASTRREQIKARIKELGLRVNDITGAVGQGAEVARLVAQLAKTYIDEGANTLSEVSGRMKEDLPDLTDNDIFNALGGRTKSGHKRIIGEANKRLSELKKQARLWAQISDALDKHFDTQTVAKDSPHVADLRAILGELRLQAMRVTKKDADLKKINDTINSIQDQLEGGFRVIPEKSKPKAEDSVDVAELRKQARDLESLMRTTDKIYDLEEQLRTGEFDVSAPEKRIIRNAQLQEALVKRQQLQREVNNRIEALRKKSAWEKTVDVLTLPRSLLTTADMSATLRQAAFLSPSRPIIAAKAFSQAFKAFFSQNTADAIDLAIRMHPNQVERTRAGLFLSELDTAPNRHEEQFASNLAARIPYIGAIVRASERNMMTTLNLIRVGAFDKFIKDHPLATLEQKKAFAAYVNVASGRGDLGKFNAATRELNMLFFAPRYAVSRFQTMTSLIKNRNDPVVRKEIGKDLLAFITMGMTVLGLASLAGLKVGLDWEDSDFGKFIIGDTRYDLWGGFQQPARLLLTAMFKGLDALGLHKSEKKIDLLDAGMRFGSYKLAPSITIPLALVEGKNIVGIPQTPTETIIRSITPLVTQDVFEAYEAERRLDRAAMAGTGSFFGAGVNTYKRRSPYRNEYITK